MEKGSVIVADRYYNDFPMLNIWDSKGVFFVIRHKHNLSYTSITERELPENTAQHVLKDEEIELENPQSKAKYPGKLRRVVVWDEENKQTIELITNNFKWAAQTIGDLYKSRWEIEVFFRDIKQLLHIKTFIGTSKRREDFQNQIGSNDAIGIISSPKIGSVLINYQQLSKGYQNHI